MKSGEPPHYVRERTQEGRGVTREAEESRKVYISEVLNCRRAKSYAFLNEFMALKMT